MTVISTSHTLFQETLDYLYSKLPMFQRQGGSAFKKGLERTEQLCWELDMPQWKFPSVHVAGTNGKGSVSSMLASILQEAGYKTGLYTSPHLRSFTERIRINGAPISEEEVVEWVDAYRLVIEQVNPSFFELTVGMAFEYFAEQEVDIAIVETGMGGRLDSTNVIRPEMSIITQIGWDHMEYLGDSLDKIAAEKAGIIKKYTPVVVGKRHEETDGVFAKRAFELSAPLFFAEDQLEAESAGQTDTHQLIRIGDQTYELDLMGYYQIENLRTVLQSVEVLREDGWEISDEAIVNGLRKVRTNTGLRGRMEELSSHPRIICDVAHNRDGLEMILPQIQNLPKRRLHMVWGMVSDKNHADILSMLPSDASYYFVKAEIPRALSATELKAKAEKAGLEGEAFETVEEGLNRAIEHAEADDLIFIGGSTFVVADALNSLDTIRLSELV